MTEAEHLEATGWTPPLWALAVVIGGITAGFLAVLTATTIILATLAGTH